MCHIFSCWGAERESCVWKSWITICVSRKRPKEKLQGEKKWIFSKWDVLVIHENLKVYMTLWAQTFFIKPLQHKNNLCRRVGRRRYADLSHSALDTLAQWMSSSSLCWIMVIFAKKKNGEVVFETFSILNSWWMQEVRGCTLLFPVYLTFFRLVSRTAWCRRIKLEKEKGRSSERETNHQPLNPQLWLFIYWRVLHKTWHKHAPSAPLQTNSTTGYNSPSSFI